MKKILFSVMLTLLLVGCSSKGQVYKYTTDEFKEVLDSGENVVGVNVLLDVDIIEYNFFFGPAIRTDSYMTFVSDNNRPDVEEGDRIIVEIVGYQQVAGAWIVGYKAPEEGIYYRIEE